MEYNTICTVLNAGSISPGSDQCQLAAVEKSS